jgi:hypothetical protein
MKARIYFRFPWLLEGKWKNQNSQDSVQGLFVYRHLDGDVWEGVIDGRVWSRFDGRVVYRVSMILFYGADAVGVSEFTVPVREVKGRTP